MANALCDLIAYIGVEFDKEGNSHRYLYTRQTPTVFAGSRWKYLEPKIEFGYDELVNAIGDAIEKQKTMDGATVVEHQEFKIAEGRPFSEAIVEAKQLWTQYLEQSKDEEDKEYRLKVLNEIISKNFGRTIKLSQTLPSQQDLLELTVDDFKGLF